MLECWEEFLKGPVKQNASSMRVSLNRKREIRLNMPAMKGLGEPEAVVLLYDRLNSRIGIRASRADVPNAYPLRRNTNGLSSRYGRIYASSFCRFHQIRNDKTIFFADARQDNNGVLVLDLKQSYERR